MEVIAIEWDEANRAHFAEHERCGVEQVDDVLTSRCHPTRSRVIMKTSEGRQHERRKFEGQTCRGRYLVVIGATVGRGVVRPITCWPLSGGNLDKYLGWRVSLPGGKR